MKKIKKKRKISRMKMKKIFLKKITKKQNQHQEKKEDILL